MDMSTQANIQTHRIHSGKKKQNQKRERERERGTTSADTQVCYRQIT